MIPYHVWTTQKCYVIGVSYLCKPKLMQTSKPIFSPKHIYIYTNDTKLRKKLMPY